MPTQTSNCCNAPVEIKQDGSGGWYVCTKCKKEGVGVAQMTSNEERELIDGVCDGLIERLGLEPDGHKTWAKTTDEIVETIKPILIEALQTAERRGREEVLTADDGDYVKVPMTVIKHIWDMRMPQTPHWRESGEIHYNKAIEDILRLIKPKVLAPLKPTSEEER